MVQPYSLPPMSTYKHPEMVLSGTNNFAKLPTEITLNIFGYLSHSELFNSALVCREWYFTTTVPILHYDLDLSSLHQSSLTNYAPPTTLSRYLRMARNLTFKSPSYISTNSILSLLTYAASSTNLRSITLSSISNARSASPALAHFFTVTQSAQLTHVDLSNTSITTSVVYALLQSHRGTLKTLILDFTEIGDSALKAIATGTALETISIGGCFGLSKRALRRFLVRRIPEHVKSVNLRWSPDVKLAWVWEMLMRVGAHEDGSGMLAELDVSGCEKLTLADIDGIQKRWPELKVRHTVARAGCVVWGYKKYVALLATLQAEPVPLLQDERKEENSVLESGVYSKRTVCGEIR